MVLSKKSFLLFHFFFFAVSIEAASFYRDKVWLKLLHVKGGESLADGQNFFLAKNGKENAKAELAATIKAFEQNQDGLGLLKLSIDCAFPARKIFLEQAGLIKKRSVSCPDFERWKKEIDPESLTLVFSTAYPNNPASMFGHTFLRFNKAGGKNDLLDYGTSFEAKVNSTDSGLLYGMRGVFGGYPGFFDLSPYYEKVGTYVHGESRDLWEYELKIEKEKIDFLLAHLWELYQTTYFDYYFFGENCSYHLAELLNLVLDPEIEIPSRFYYLPGDLVYSLKRKKDLVSKISYRPSLKKQFENIYERLSKRQKDKVKGIFQGEELTKKESTEEFDALIMLFQLELFKAKDKKLNKRSRTTLNQALRARSKKGRATNLGTMIPSKNRPDLAHGAQKIFLGFSLLGNGKKKRKHFGYQGGYHDLMASDLGLMPFSDFRFLYADLFYDDDDKKFDYQTIEVIRVTSLHPLHFYAKSLSWKVGLWFDEIKFLEKRGQHQSSGEAKLGFSFGDERIIFSLLGGGKASHSRHFKKKARVGLTFESLLLISLADRFKLKMSFDYQNDFTAKWSDSFYLLGEVGLAYHYSREFELRYSYSFVSKEKVLSKNRDEHSFTLAYYF